MENTGKATDTGTGGNKDDKNGEDPANKFKLDKQGQPATEEGTKTATAKNECACWAEFLIFKGSIVNF